MSTESEFKSSIEARLLDLLESGKDSDIEFLLTDGERMKGHVLIFSNSSPVFRAMFHGSLPEKSTVVINDVEPEAFKTMAKFIYSDRLSLNTISHALSVYMAGNKYDLPTLVKLAEEFIVSNVTEGDALEVLEFSKVYDNTTIENTCKEVIDKDPAAVIKLNNFFDFSLGTIENIVTSFSSKVNEIEMLKFIEAWAKHKEKNNEISLSNLRPSLVDIITKINLHSVLVGDFCFCLLQSELNFTDTEKMNLLFPFILPQLAVIEREVIKGRQYGTP